MATAELAISASLSLISISNVFYFLLIPALLLWFVHWKMSRRHMYKLAEKIPGPPGWPLVGNAFEVWGKSSPEIFEVLYSYTAQYDCLAKVWFGPKLYIVIGDPQDIEVILGSHEHIDKSSDYGFFEPWLGNGLLISTGPKWRAHRKLIAPTFHLNVLKTFIELFNANSRATVEKMRKEEGKFFDCHDYMSEATVEILLETVMGVSKKALGQSGLDYAMAVMKMCDILHIRHTNFFLRSDWLFKLTKYSKIQEKLLNTIHSLTKRVLKNKKEAFNRGIRGSIAEVPSEVRLNKKDDVKVKPVVENLSFGQAAGLKDDLDVDDNDVGEKKRSAFLDLMIEASQSEVVISDEEIKEQVDTIMFEGHDTTAAASSFFLSIMGIYPEVQAKVVKELKDIFGDSDRPATFADTLEMKYLERCLMETIRLYPPVPLITRVIKEDVKLVSSDCTLPAGATIVMPIIRIHRREAVYPNADTFDPDNFLPERTVNRHYYAFIPFSAGPRSCVGRKYAMLKLKILLSTIMRNYHVSSEAEEKDFKLQGDIILKRSEGFNIKLETRRFTEIC